MIKGKGYGRHQTNDLNETANILRRQLLCRGNQGGQALNYQQAGIERAAQQYEQAARVKIHVVVANTAANARSDVISHLNRQPKYKCQLSSGPCCTS